MPKVVDHEQRRRAIIKALWQIARDSGLEGVSLGQVATAAGVSKGLVQHYFGTRDQMLVYATGYLRENIEQRIAAQLSSAPDDPEARLRAILRGLLPTDPNSRTESLVANAFLIRARSDPELASRFRAGNAQLREAIAAQIRAVQDPRAAIDPQREAALLLALASGLAEGILLGYHDTESAQTILDHQLSRLSNHPE